jgi:hypothetical protein
MMLLSPTVAVRYLLYKEQYLLYKEVVMRNAASRWPYRYRHGYEELAAAQSGGSWFKLYFRYTEAMSHLVGLAATILSGQATEKREIVWHTKPLQREMLSILWVWIVKVHWWDPHCCCS